MRGLLNKFLGVLRKFDADPAVGGLRITSSVLQYAEAPPGGARFETRLNDGVMREGVVSDEIAFREALSRLHEIIAPKQTRKTIKVVVTLPPRIVFTQVVRVPAVDEDELPETAILNIRMKIPNDFEQAYLSWQKIKEEDNQFELLGASTEKKPVDDLRDSLISAGFSPVTFEFPGLALARLAGPAVRSVQTALLVNLSDEGMGFSIFDTGVLYFDSFVMWSEAVGKTEGGEAPSFQKILARELKKVSDFSLNRLGREFDLALFIAPGFEAEAADAIKGVVPPQTRVEPFMASSDTVPGFYVALGAAMRGGVQSDDEQLISFGELNPAAVFFAERAGNFIRFWRSAFAATFCVLLVAYGALSTFFTLQNREVEERATALLSGGTSADLEEMETLVREFNQILELVRGLRLDDFDWSATLRAIYALADRNRVEILNLNAGESERAAVTGRALDYSGVLDFKEALAKVSEFKNVDLPLSRISSVGDNSVGFTLSFMLDRPARSGGSDQQ